MRETVRGTARPPPSGTCHAHRVRDELNRQAEAFGADLGAKGLFVQTYPERMYETAAEVLAKPWPREVSERLEFDAEPIILIVDREFRLSDPGNHPYALIWLSDLLEEPEAVRPLLIDLARATKQGSDVVLYLREVAERVRDEERLNDAGTAVGSLARFASYIELKPSVFGVSIDLTAILRDIAGRSSR